LKKGFGSVLTLSSVNRFKIAIVGSAKSCDESVPEELVVVQLRLKCFRIPRNDRNRRRREAERVLRVSVRLHLSRSDRPNG
jgi:hypothetical protein